MATKKRGDAQVRSALSRLKKLGLFKGRTTGKPSKYGKAKAKALGSVLAGTAKPVKVPKKVAREYRDQYRVVNGFVVIPVAKGERVRFNKKRQEITSTRKTPSGKRVTARKPRHINSPYDLPRGPNIRYVVPLAGGTMRLRWDSFDQLLKDMTQYEQGKRGGGGRYLNWWRYVEIEDIDDEDDGDE